MKNIFTISRGLDLRLSSNRFVVFLSIAAFIITLLQGIMVDSDLSYGDLFGLALRNLFIVFLTWAIGRELDPDHAITAALSAVSAAIYFVFIDDYPVELNYLLLILLSSRLIVRTTGLKFTWLDLLIYFFVTVYVYGQTDSILCLIVAIVSLSLDVILPRKNEKNVYFLILLLGILGSILFLDGITSFALGLGWPHSDRLNGGIFYLGMALTYGVYAYLAFLKPLPLVTKADQTGEELSQSRLKAGRGVALILSILSPNSYTAIAYHIISYITYRTFRNIIGELNWGEEFRKQTKN